MILKKFKKVRVLLNKAINNELIFENFFIIFT